MKTSPKPPDLKVVSFAARPSDHPLVIEAAKDLSRLHALQPDTAAGLASLIALTLQEATRTTHTVPPARSDS